MTPATRSELRTGAVVTASVVAAGIPVAVVWWLIAPLPLLEKTGPDGVFYAESGSEVAIAADGWFAICTATAGLVAALLVFALARRTRVGALLGLAVGGLLASLLAWRLGVVLGPDAALETAKSLPVPSRFEGPLDLSARGVLFAWPLASVVAYFALTAGLEPPGERVELGAAGPPFPVTVLRPAYDRASVDRLFHDLDSGDLSVEQARVQPLRAERFHRGYDATSVDAALELRRVRALGPPSVNQSDPAGGSAQSSPP